MSAGVQNGLYSLPGGAGGKQLIAHQPCVAGGLQRLVDPGEGDLPGTGLTAAGGVCRVGITMQFAPGFESVLYYAKGPRSNYIDRQRGSLLGW